MLGYEKKKFISKIAGVAAGLYENNLAYSENLESVKYLDSRQDCIIHVDCYCSTLVRERSEFFSII